ncbi:hypothetical protein KX935_07840 [Streptobacillus moniliformis]|uniref:hypothetical protein n=1 Tax=Streptobacillus moniliformis TaxID=34105 RepID=UPI0007E35559|nr:hypothetical protein [Streptobacillus moniliformis]QXW65656.1 hypothetical protein KX935_07840 [Streptobacillus moniliformis]
MIVNTERHLYDFLKRILTKEKLKSFCDGIIDYDINIYRGFLPTNDFADRENGNKTNNYFPFVLLRIVNFSQETIGINSYEAPVDIEIWIGTKEEKEEDYIKNLALGDYIRQQLLSEVHKKGAFAVDVTKNFSVNFFSDKQEPFFYSKIDFVVYGEPVEPISNWEENKWI